MSKNATIYLRTKDVIDVPDSEGFDPQHSYLVADFGGKQYILRAGPGGKNPIGGGGNALIGNLEFIGAENLVEYLPKNSPSTHYDWDFEGNHNAFEIYSGSDEEVANKFQILRQKAIAINSYNLDYRWNNQNCNTAMAYVLKDSKLEVDLNNLYDKNGKKLWMVGGDEILLYDQPNLYEETLNSFFEFTKSIKEKYFKVKINNDLIVEKDGLSNMYADSGLIKSDAIYVDESGEFVDNKELIYQISNNGTSYTIIRGSVGVLNEDSSITTLDSIISNFKAGVKYTEEFIKSSFEDIIKEYSSPDELASLLLTINEGLNKNLSIQEIAKIISTKLTVKSFFEDLQNQTLFNSEDYDKILAENFEELSPEGIKILEMIRGSSFYQISYISAISFATEIILKKGDLNAQEYTAAAFNSIAQASASVAIEEASKLELLGNIPYVGSVYRGLGYGITQLISVAISDFFADDKMNSRQWQTSLSSAGVVACAAGVGSAIASAIYAGAFAGPVGAAVAVIIAYTLMGGKKLEAGEYFDKINFYNSVLKENGIDSDFFALDSRGSMIKASPYYNDDIYGNVGNDSLIGGNGTNKIIAYGGNDQIFGKGDNDIIFGNSGADEIIAGEGDDYAFGGDGDDIIFGGIGDDIIFGGEVEITKNNEINKLAMATSDNDFIRGGLGDDKIFAQEGDDLIFGDSGDDLISGDDGDDIIFSGSGLNVVKAGAGNDIIFSGQDGDNIFGENGDDEIFGGVGDDIIYGDEGSDIIDGDAGDDLILGGAGNDIIYAGNDNSEQNKFSGKNYKNSIHGEFGNDYLIGSNSNDLISDGNGDDIIFGGMGNDKIILGEGNNSIFFNKNDGEDLIEIFQQDGVFEVDNFGKNIIRFSNFNFNENSQKFIQIQRNQNDLIINFIDENNNILNDKIVIKNQYYSTSDPDKILIKTLEFDNNISIDLSLIKLDSLSLMQFNFSKIINQEVSIQQEFLNAYQDQISIAKDLNNINFFGANNSENIFKNSSGEIEKVNSEIINQIEWQSIKKQRNIFGGHYQVWREIYQPMMNLDSENSRAIGNFWSENIYGNLYQNQINGGSGDDRIYGFAGDDVLFGGSGNDIINGGDNDDLILGGDGQDIIEGGLGSDEIYGNQGNDVIQDLDGKNLIFGGGGEDEIVISNSGNQIFGEAGNDRIYVKNLIEQIPLDFSNQDLKNNANEGNIIYANSGNDSVILGSGDDYIFGQNGADFIDGGGGRDYISGGEGDDQLNGNYGDDKIFGDIGNDFIKGGSGNDLIWGGGGVDFIECEDGNDLVRAGLGDDEIYAGLGDDKIYGEAGADLIHLQEGNNYAFGGLGGDIIYGGNGDDKIYGEDGNDFIADGAGSDVINGGLGNDLIVIEALKNQQSTIDIIENFDKNNDKIIIKTDYKNPLSFAQIISNAQQVDKNLELNLGQDQKIIFLDTKINDLNQENLKIGYAINAESKILFGENSGQILFGDEQNNQIIGSDFNDELFGGGGYDELFGMKGDDILHYEADGKFIKLEQQIYGDEILFYKTREMMLSKIIINLPPAQKYFTYKPSNKVFNLINTQQNSVFESAYDLVNIQKISQYAITLASSKVQYEPFLSSSNIYFQSVDKVDYLFNKISQFSTTNFYNSQNYEITGYNKSNDNFDGGEGFNSILMTNGNDFLSFDDNLQSTNSQSRIKSIEAIFAFDGDDIINFTSQKFSMNNLIVHGGLGNDKLWLGSGNDFIFGNEGNDEIFGGNGDDFINGGTGNDIVFGGDGNDIVDGYYGADKIYLEKGNDIVFCGEFTQEIIGGDGVDEVNLNNFTSSITIDLSNNFIQKNLQSSKIIIREIENIVATNFDDEIIGDNVSNLINGGLGNDLISGGGGNDIYFFDEGWGVDKIIESGKDVADLIKFSSAIKLENLCLERVDNNLEIFTDKQKNNKIIIENQFIDNVKIDSIELADGSKINIPQQFLIFEEDQEIIFNEEYFQKNFDNKKQLKNLTFQSRNGNFIFDQISSIITYKTINNFNGFDEIEIIDQDSKSEKILVYFNQKNDNPEGFISDFSFKVNQEIKIDFNQYFQDVDGDKMRFNLSLAGFNELPNWINFNQEIGILETKIPRNGALNFKIKIFDENGGEIEQFFKINLSRDIVQDANKVINKNQINGDVYNNKIYAQSLSNDIVSGESGDDEIFYVEDAKWQNNDEINFRAWNIYSGDEFDVSNKIKSFDCFDGGSGYDILHLTKMDDALFLDDQNLSDFGEIAKFSDIEEIRAGGGDDIIDMTSFNFIYGDIKILGEAGNDILWSSSGDDKIFGGNGDDNIQSAIGNDEIFGEDGDDILKAYYGDDLLVGGLGADKLYGGKGADIFLYENKADSTFDKQDIIADFEINFDKISFKNFDYNAIYKYLDVDSNLQGQDSKALFYKIDNNLNTIIFDNNSDFSLMLSGRA
jgi:Ca2+-binding RTX toxin-like protein